MISDMTRLRIARSCDTRVFQALLEEALAEERDRLISTEVTEYQRGRVAMLKDLLAVMPGSSYYANGGDKANG